MNRPNRPVVAALVLVLAAAVDAAAPAARVAPASGPAGRPRRRLPHNGRPPGPGGGRAGVDVGRREIRVAGQIDQGCQGAGAERPREAALAVLPALLIAQLIVEAALVEAAAGIAAIGGNRVDRPDTLSPALSVAALRPHGTPAQPCNGRAASVRRMGSRTAMTAQAPVPGG
ncbi:hypothetical protein ACFQ4K_10625 [Tistrella bauzanensis]